MAPDAPHADESGLSERGKSADAMNKAFMVFWDILKNLWDPETNPNGYVSLGVAENTLMHDTLREHVHSKFHISNHAFTYGEGPAGSRRLRESMARFLTKHLKPVVPFKPEHITITNGCSGAIEHLSWVIANPGEAFLLGQPYYGTFIPDLSFRTGAKVIPVPFGDIDPMSKEGVARYESVLKEAESTGTKVRGLVLCHPHNPLGRCYSREVIVEIMKLCERHDLHLISDEIYAFSVFENTVDTSPPPVEFESASSINTEGIMDPSRLHLVWGMSKDFGANGIRIGSVITQHNTHLQSALGAVSIYSSPSSLSEHVTANVLDDDEWVENYMSQNSKLLSENYTLVTRWAKDNDITYAPGVNAAFFLWVDLGKTYRARHPQAEEEKLGEKIMGLLLKEKVFVTLGESFGAEKDGWFRIVFSSKKHHLEEGLKRIIAALGR